MISPLKTDNFLFPILLWILLELISLQAYTQEIRMIPEGASYGYTDCYGPPGLKGSGCYGHSEVVKNLRDTVINNKIYQVSSFGITRYENKKFYYYNQNTYLQQYNFKDNEYVLYDFGLQVNDTFNLPYPRTFEDNQLVVVSKTNRLMQNGEYRIELKLNSKHWSFDWIEGIGDIWNGYYYISQINLYDIYSSMVCFSDKNGIIFKKDNFDYPCEDIDKYYVSWEGDGINDAKNNQTNVYPNPFKSVINLNLNLLPNESDVNINLYSFNGILLNSFRIEERGQIKKTINLSYLKSGLYFLSIKSMEGTNYFTRIIKE